MTTSLEGLTSRAGPPPHGGRHSSQRELRAELISGGRSNLTFLVADDKSKWVVRRPPLHGLTPSAHDMAREYRDLAALQDTAFPVARTVAMRATVRSVGAPMQMVEFVPGRSCRRPMNLRPSTIRGGSVSASTH